MSEKPQGVIVNFDAVVIGAGFAGMYMLHRLRKLGVSARVYESGDGVGGTWYWNRYPGARCDVESLQYSYSFDDQLQQEWEWTERYPRQDEILRYLDHVADRFDLRKDIQFETRVTSATYDEDTGLWTITTDRGDRVVARFLISAMGCLSASQVPKIPGLDTFKGKWYHTGQWPHERVDFTGKRVGVIGTGSSGVQAITAIAKEAAELVVFQRTPNFSVPAWNGPLTNEAQKAWKAKYAEYRQIQRTSKSGSVYDYGTRAGADLTPEELEAEYDRRWARGGPGFMHCFTDILTNKATNDTAVAYVHRKIRSIVKDTKVADLLCPTDHPIGTKRICVDTGYYETFNEKHVHLVNLRATPIEEIVPEGIRTSDKVHELDAIVFATGYDAVTGAIVRVDIRGKGGQSLKEKWTAGPRCYLGLMSQGFPNLFFVTGPGSPSITTNVVVSIEQHVDWIARCIDHMNAHGLTQIDALQPNEDAWVDNVNALAANTMLPNTNSWFVGANIPGKPRVFLPYIGGLGKYTTLCEEIIAEGYRGFSLK
jgi:cyclohexanone monooxygenase